MIFVNVGRSLKYKTTRTRSTTFFLQDRQCICATQELSERDRDTPPSGQRSILHTGLTSAMETCNDFSKACTTFHQRLESHLKSTTERVVLSLGAANDNIETAYQWIYMEYYRLNELPTQLQISTLTANTTTIVWNKTTKSYDFVCLL